MTRVAPPAPARMVRIRTGRIRTALLRPAPAEAEAAERPVLLVDPRQRDGARRRPVDRRRVQRHRAARGMEPDSGAGTGAGERGAMRIRFGAVCHRMGAAARCAGWPYPRRGADRRALGLEHAWRDNHDDAGGRRPRCRSRGGPVRGAGAVGPGAERQPAAWRIRVGQRRQRCQRYRRF